MKKIARIIAPACLAKDLKGGQGLRGWCSYQQFGTMERLGTRDFPIAFMQ